MHQKKTRRKTVGEESDISSVSGEDDDDDRLVSSAGGSDYTFQKSSLNSEVKRCKSLKETAAGSQNRWRER